MEIRSEVVEVGAGSDFTECKVCKQLMARQGHDDGRCYECRRDLYYLAPMIERLKSMDESLRLLAKRPSSKEEKKG